MLRLISNCLFPLLLFQSIVCGAISKDTITVPYPAHAHNDYIHEHPLFDALENGFRSIEADVFTLGDSLYVAHDRKDIKPGRTLRELYLEPLQEYISDNEKTIYESASVGKNRFRSGSVPKWTTIFNVQLFRVSIQSKYHHSKLPTRPESNRYPSFAGHKELEDSGRSYGNISSLILSDDMVKN